MLFGVPVILGRRPRLTLTVAPLALNTCDRATNSRGSSSRHAY